MSLRYIVLGMLAEKPMHGYELTARFESATAGAWQMNIGQVYGTLARLEMERSVRRIESRGSDKFGRKVFQITNHGHQEFRDWLERGPLKPEPVRSEFFLRAMFATSDSSLRDLVERQLEILALESRRLREKTKSVRKNQGGLFAQAALARADSERSWLYDFERTLRSDQRDKRAERGDGSKHRTLGEAGRKVFSN